MENKESIDITYKCNSCKNELRSDIIRNFCPQCFSTSFHATPTPTAVDELDLEDDNEDISHLAGLPISEIYLHGVIAGKEKLIRQLKKELAHTKTKQSKVVEVIEAEIKFLNTTRPNKISYDTDCIKFEVLTDLLTKLNKEL